MNNYSTRGGKKSTSRRTNHCPQHGLSAFEFIEISIHRDNRCTLYGSTHPPPSVFAEGQLRWTPSAPPPPLPLHEATSNASYISDYSVRFPSPPTRGHHQCRPPPYHSARKCRRHLDYLTEESGYLISCEVYRYSKVREREREVNEKVTHPAIGT